MSFAVGAAIPLLVFALAGRRVAERVRGFQRHTRGIRVTGGVVMIALAGALALNLPAALQRALPDYTGALQQRVDENDAVREALDLGGLVTDENRELSNCSNGAPVLEDCGTAPELRGIDTWLNTPGGEALTLEGLRGKVVLVDFWTYSCINCQRAIPHVNAWYYRYRDVGAGFEVVGVHTPEFAFERETRNVVAGAGPRRHLPRGPGQRVRDLDRLPEPLLARAVPRRRRRDRAPHPLRGGRVRGHRAPGARAPRGRQPGRGAARAHRRRRHHPAGRDDARDLLLHQARRELRRRAALRRGEQDFTLADDQRQDTFSLGGTWDVDFQGATAVSDDARVRLAYRSTDVFTVLGGEGTVTARVTTDGRTTTREIDVSGSPTLYPVLEGDGPTEGLVELDVPPGVQVFTATFG